MTEEITLLMKGADSVMSQIVQYNDWLDEECSTMAREGIFNKLIFMLINSHFFC